MSGRKSPGWLRPRPAPSREERDMQLISLPVSPFAARVRIAAYAKGLDLDIVPPPAGWPNNAQYRDISPMGRVPALILEDHRRLPDHLPVLEDERWNASHGTDVPVLSVVRPAGGRRDNVQVQTLGVGGDADPRGER